MLPIISGMPPISSGMLLGSNGSYGLGTVDAGLDIVGLLYQQQQQGGVLSYCSADQSLGGAGLDGNLTSTNHQQQLDLMGPALLPQQQKQQQQHYGLPMHQQQQQHCGLPMPQQQQQQHCGLPMHKQQEQQQHYGLQMHQQQQHGLQMQEQQQQQHYGLPMHQQQQQLLFELLSTAGLGEAARYGSVGSSGGSAPLSLSGDGSSMDALVAAQVAASQSSSYNSVPEHRPPQHHAAAAAAAANAGVQFSTRGGRGIPPGFESMYGSQQQQHGRSEGPHSTLVMICYPQASQYRISYPQASQ
jgi:hypothetical protein